MSATALRAARLRRAYRFDPDQPRAPDGRWVGTGLLGLSPARTSREGLKAVSAYFATPRYRGFEKKIHDAFPRAKVERTTGVYRGGMEPSALVHLPIGEDVRIRAGELGRSYNQDAVAVFEPAADGPHARLLFPTDDPEATLEKMRERGVEFATVRPTGVEVWDLDGSIAALLAELAAEEGAKLRVRPGAVSFLERGRDYREGRGGELQGLPGAHRPARPGGGRGGDGAAGRVHRLGRRVAFFDPGQPRGPDGRWIGVSTASLAWDWIFDLDADDYSAKKDELFARVASSGFGLPGRDDLADLFELRGSLYEPLKKAAVEEARKRRRPVRQLTAEEQTIVLRAYVADHWKRQPRDPFGRWIDMPGFDLPVDGPDGFGPDGLPFSDEVEEQAHRLASAIKKVVQDPDLDEYVKTLAVARMIGLPPPPRPDLPSLEEAKRALEERYPHLAPLPEEGFYRQDEDGFREVADGILRQPTPDGQVIDLSGLESEYAAQAQEALDQVVEEFPDLREKLRVFAAFSDPHAPPRTLEAEQLGKVTGALLFGQTTRNPIDGTSSIFLTNDGIVVAEMENSGEATATYRGGVLHELGHAVVATDTESGSLDPDAWVLGDHKFISDFMDSLVDAGFPGSDGVEYDEYGQPIREPGQVLIPDADWLGEYISPYGATHPMEFFAEVFAILRQPHLEGDYDRDIWERLLRTADLMNERRGRKVL